MPRPASFTKGDEGESTEPSYVPLVLSRSSGSVNVL